MKRAFCLFLFAVCVYSLCFTSVEAFNPYTTYLSNKNTSDNIPLYDSFVLTLTEAGCSVDSAPDAASSLLLDFEWGPLGQPLTNISLCLSLDGVVRSHTIESRIFVTNVFSGLEWDTTAPSTLSANGTASSSALDVSFSLSRTLLSSQGSVKVTEVHSLTTQNDGSLSYKIDRDTHDTTISYFLQPVSSLSPSSPAHSSPPPHLPFPRSSPANSDHTYGRSTSQYPLSSNGFSDFSSKNAGLSGAPYVFSLSDNWSIKNLGLGANMLLLSLQGLANRNGSLLYFEYPTDWPFSYTAMLQNYYETHRDISFSKLQDVESVVATFLPFVKGYVVWDKAVPPSLSVALTLAGLKDAVVVTSDLIPLIEAGNVPLVADFRGMFSGWSDAEIISWNFDKYFDATKHKYLMWLGGSCGDVEHPAVADFGIMQRAFFAGDLSTKPSDTVEFNLATKIMGAMPEKSIVVGWHSYCKDAEHWFTSMASRNGLRVHGLNTLPDLSFINTVPLKEGFEFKNNRKPFVELNKEKVYISCVQSDGIGLGAWDKPGRGKIPYTWEVTLNDLWMQPTLLEMIYNQSTPNDYFVGALSGPGYMYPKAIPTHLLPELISLAQTYMHTLDLNGFAMMDESEGTTIVGNMNLPKEVVDTYFTSMPDSIGFVNGYAPSFTFAREGERPFLSYDYYLAPDRPIQQAAYDLRELAKVNHIRPYYLVIHVREFSNILRVQEVLKLLGDEFELVDTETLLKSAGKNPTFTTRYRDDPQ